MRAFLRAFFMSTATVWMVILAGVIGLLWIPYNGCIRRKDAPAARVEPVADTATKRDVKLALDDAGSSVAIAKSAETKAQEAKNAVEGVKVEVEGLRQRIDRLSPVLPGPPLIKGPAEPSVVVSVAVPVLPPPKPPAPSKTSPAPMSAHDMEIICRLVQQMQIDENVEKDTSRNAECAIIIRITEHPGEKAFISEKLIEVLATDKWQIAGRCLISIDAPASILVEKGLGSSNPQVTHLTRCILKHLRTSPIPALTKAVQKWGENPHLSNEALKTFGVIGEEYTGQKLPTPRVK